MGIKKEQVSKKKKENEDIRCAQEGMDSEGPISKEGDENENYDEGGESGERE